MSREDYLRSMGETESSIRFLSQPSLLEVFGKALDPRSVTMEAALSVMNQAREAALEKVVEMTLRSRCEALVREWREQSEARYPRGTAAQVMRPETRYEIEGRCEQLDHCADHIQSALDATADEGRDAARYRWLRQMIYDDTIIVQPERMLHGPELDAAIDQAMKESKP